MPAVLASLEYLQRHPRYNEEKPYWCLLAPEDGFDPEKQRADNLEFESRSDIVIEDIRDFTDEVDIEHYGFQVIQHQSKLLSFENGNDVEAYRLETERLLHQTLNADFVKCYHSRLRKNVSHERREYDINDPLLVEGPARGAHNDVTYDSGPSIINQYLSKEQKEQYLRSGWRLRIINTWRPLIPVLQDRPLALCDSRSVSPEDLIAADRIIPDRVGEVYYLHYNKAHSWYWLERQTPAEPFAFVMYDTKAGPHARFCPHVSFVNTRAPKDANPRQSIETRSIVVTKS